MGTLVPHCENILVNGTPKQAKQAVRCLNTNMKESARNQTFSQVLDVLRVNLDPTNPNYRTAIIALGHIALLMPDEFKVEMKGIISQKVFINPFLPGALKHTDE